MGKMIIVDDDGTSWEFKQFIAVGVGGDGRIERMIEDEGMERQTVLACMIAMTKLLGEMAEAIMPDVPKEEPPEGKEEPHG